MSGFGLLRDGPGDRFIADPTRPKPFGGYYPRVYVTRDEAEEVRALVGDAYRIVPMDRRGWDSVPPIYGDSPELPQP